MKTTDVRVTDLPADHELSPEELERIQGGRTGALVCSPVEEKYRPDPVSVWTREVVEDVEAY